jgi:hypothetical protein
VSSFRRSLGAALLDGPRSLWCLRDKESWVLLRNRQDRVISRTDPLSLLVESDQTSSLHLADVFPSFGRKLQNRILSGWDFQFASTGTAATNPVFSFIIPHRGEERTSLLLATLRSIAVLGVRAECIVVEQDVTARLSLPDWVTHVHAPHPSGDSKWRKCFAFNRGAMVARGNYLVCHDNDIVVPANYLEILTDLLERRGFDAVWPQRFLFYLCQSATNQLLHRLDSAVLRDWPSEVIKQNWTGGTLAIRKDAYFKVGGFDEEFTGWTGEDREFYDRCKTLNTWYFGYVPFLHLWHSPQSGRTTVESRQAAWAFTKHKLATDRQHRVNDNCRRNFGDLG